METFRQQSQKSIGATPHRVGFQSSEDVSLDDLASVSSLGSLASVERGAKSQFPEEPWNLDSVRMKKLQRIMRAAEAKKHFDNPNLTKTRKEVRMAEIEKLMYTRQREYQTRRLKLSRMTDGNRFAIMGDEMLLRQEITLGRGVNERDPFHGRTLLIDAAASGSLNVVYYLLREAKADPNVPSMMGETTALHVAVANGYRQLASMLILHGANYNARDREGCVPLHLVTKLSLVKLLMKFDIDALVRSRKGMLPSEYWLKHVPPDEQDPAVERALLKLEDQQSRELVKQKVQQHAIESNVYRDINLVTSQDSTLQRSEVSKQLSGAPLKIEIGGLKGDIGSSVKKQSKKDEEDKKSQKTSSFRAKNNFPKVNKERHFHLETE